MSVSRRNVELKARVAPDGVSALRERVVALATNGPEALRQDDTFFHCANGRLKLRVPGRGSAQLIFYRREDSTGPKTSSFDIVTGSAPEALREVLAKAYDIQGRVRKERELFWVDRTRIHLDQVEGLGSFLELEVQLASGEDPALGEAEARDLLDALEISRLELVQGSYLDLLGTTSSE